MNAQPEIKSSNAIVTQPAIVQFAESVGLTTQAFITTFRMVAMPKDHSEAEFVACVLVAKEHGLNPLTKEIYFMRTKSGVIQPIVGVDGWVRKLNEHPQFDGLEFEDKTDENGNIVSMTCIIYRKDRSRPTKVTEYMSEGLASGGPVWKTNRNRMLRHRTLSQGVRYSIGFAGVMDRDEFDDWQHRESMKDVTPQRATAIEPPDPDAVPVPPVPSQEPGPEHVELPQNIPQYLVALNDAMELAGTDPDLVTEVRDANASIVEALPNAERKAARRILKLED